ncbi:MAG: hypothetical protein C5B49_10105 [Bdellovibrio sp.]|nr:MAG: hypothetical protein C5B49_10105 [Bdellovibrio sp.]
MAAAIISCAHQQDRRGTGFSESMLHQSEILPKVILLVQDDDVEKSAEKQSRLKELTKKLASNTHEIDQKLHASSDPALQFVSRDFSKDLDGTLALMDDNKWSQARTNLSKVTHYCVACHTMQQGPSMTGSIQDDLKNLTPLQRGDYYAALRNFDEAIISYEQGLRDTKLAKENPRAWDEAVQKLLAITVRVKDNASLTLEVISQFFDADSYPKDLVDSAHRWRRQAKEWRNSRGAGNKRNPGSIDKSGKPEKSEKKDLMAEARKLYEQASHLSGKGKADSFLLYLRASSALHTYLSDAQNSRDQEALLLSGRTAKALANMNFWTFPEDYFKACAAVDEKTTIAEQCRTELAQQNGGK